MSQQTVQTLIDLNRNFYEMNAEDFSKTRNSSWKGWKQLVPLLPKRRPLTVLDVGCGNGRFGEFLLQESIDHTYMGIDGSAALLRLAQERLPQGRFMQHDITNSLGATTYDVVVAFGVLHHIPTPALRSEVMSALERLVLPSGILAISLWQFTQNERLMKRAVKLDAPGDFLLPWGQQMEARYCHSFEGETIHTGLSLVAEYEADLANRYLVWEKGV